MIPARALCLLLAGAWSLLAPGPGHARPDATMEAALVPGDRGVVLTALQGEQIQEIPVRYLGTSKDFLGPGMDLLLVQLEGEEAEAVGVAAGMSGSPVYFGGRLVGALSYRLGSLPRRPVAGVTPLADMLRAASPAVADRVVSSPARSLATPIATPLLVGGVVEPVRRWMAPDLEQRGFVLAGGGNAGAAGSVAAPLRPGSPVGVELVRGDLAIAATGTVTWVDGDEVYAFGHPFLGSGNVEIPMVSATIIHTLADLAGSLKLANTGAPLGAIVEDRLSAIVGRLGREAQLLPVDLRVVGANYGEATYRFEVARIRSLTPLLAGAVVANALMANVAYDRETTMFASGRIRMAGLPDLPLELVAAADGGSEPSLEIARTIQFFVGGLSGTSLADVRIEAIDFEVRVLPRVIQYDLVGVNYDRRALRPGQLLELDCVLRRHRGETVTRRIVVPIPRDLPADADLRLAVGSPGNLEAVLGHPNDRRVRSATDMVSLIHTLAERRAAHRLTAVLYRPAPEVIDRGTQYSALPPTVQRLLAAQTGSRLMRNGAEELGRHEVELDGPVRGTERIRLTVDPGLQEEHR